MTKQAIAGKLAALWRFPVKSMKGESLAEAEVTALGLVGDRAYALIDVETGKVASAKSVNLFPNLFDCRAEFVDPPQRGEPLPVVRISFPDGRTVRSDAPDVDAVLSAFLGRPVRLSKAAPEDFVIDQYHPDIEGADFGGARNTVVAQKLGAALFAQLGMESPVPDGLFFDAFPVSVITTSTLNRLEELVPQSRFDARRFRMNLVLETSEPGFIENDWIGRQLAVGDDLQLAVALQDPRCVMATLAQDELPRDMDVLRALVKHNRIQVATLGLLPCAGVYAVVGQPGRVRVGDTVSFLAA